MGQDNGLEGAGEHELMPLLREANEVVQGARMDEYGKPENSFSRIAALWSAYLDGEVTLTERDVAAMMVLLKVARGTRKRDNWVDVAGYAAIAADRLP